MKTRLLSAGRNTTSLTQDTDSSNEINLEGICMTGPLCWAAEIGTTLSINYALIGKKKAKRKYVWPKLGTQTTTLLLMGH